MSLNDLRRKHPWPDAKPDVPPNPHGWCQPEHREMLAPYLSVYTKRVVELGAWLGQSTRLLLALAPNATVISVDHWNGSTDMMGKPELEAMFPTAYETFLVNQWEWKDRVIPMRLDSYTALSLIAICDVEPDLIFFDTEHTTPHLLGELTHAHEAFPQAQLYGDDWGWESVRAAVEQFAKLHHYRINACGNAWALDR